MSTSFLSIRTVLGFIAAIIGLLILLTYVSFQARFLILGPQLSLTNEPPTTTNERFVTLTGQARNITRITLNGKQIFTNQDGYFSEAMMLENGYTIATVAATDRFGRTAELVREFMYLPASVPSSTPEVITN